MRRFAIEAVANKVVSEAVSQRPRSQQGSLDFRFLIVKGKGAVIDVVRETVNERFLAFLRPPFNR